MKFVSWESILFRCYQFYLVATNFILCSRLHLVKKIILLSQIKSDFVKTNLKSLPPNLFIWNEFLFLDSEFYFVGTTLQIFLMNIFNSIHRKITDKAQQHIYKVLTTFCQKTHIASNVSLKSAANQNFDIHPDGLNFVVRTHSW